ncbi:hypothetical protein AXG93_154s2050 [Marchantia polymorpha subsp. ruderalis]|uniref:Anion-transporting ATPase-like domain-containing protein n=1 Tax=Marchantia polymorpha subsp. ruderalis TaxID=1480154 RepID=A0A176VIM6_MARPO|nr:hypothetical protein AXG93_154s2050 [Marchantia polymorpha subsp. ruderalis]
MALSSFFPLKLPQLAPSRRRFVVVKCAADSPAAPPSPAKLVTFVGKGGVGKTTCAVLAAQYYASLGLRTCLAVQSQDPTADFLLGEKLGTYAAPLKNGYLSAFRVESTKLLVEPWSQLKKADAQLKFSQGALDEVVSEELSILPGMDSFLAIGLLDSLSNFTGNSIKLRPKSTEQYDVVVYDGPSSEEILRIIGAPERASHTVPNNNCICITRCIEYCRFLTSKTKKIIDTFADPKRFGCYIVTDFRSQLASETALRYWGCAVQAGVYVSGALHVGSPENSDLLSDSVREKYDPLALGEVPLLSFRAPPDWKKVLSEFQAGDLLESKQKTAAPPGVVFDKSARTVTLFLPGFAKSEIKLSQWRGGTELLVEVGDQRRSILLPPDLRGKVAGAKFLNKSLVVSIKSS